MTIYKAEYFQDKNDEFPSRAELLAAKSDLDAAEAAVSRMHRSELRMDLSTVQVFRSDISILDGQDIV